MLKGDLPILLVMGGAFLLIGLVAIIWDRKEKKRYYDSLAGRPDTREFLNGWPPRAQFGTIKIGGWVAIAIGVLLIIMGGINWLQS